MKNGGKALIFATGCIAATLAVSAAKAPSGSEPVISDNPYGAIVERNIFDLHDPPPPQVEKAKPPPSNIKLSGITTIFGMRQGLFIVNEPGAAGKPPVVRYLTLSEGQRAGALEVLQIDPKARTAKIKNDDMESLLNIETNHTAVAGGPASGGGPGARMPAYAPPAGAAPGIPQNPYTKSIPMRPVRDNQPNATPQNYGGAGAGVQPQGSSLNLAGGMATGLNQGTQQPTLPPEQSWQLMEATKAMAQQGSGNVDPGLGAIIPSTPLSAPSGNQSEDSQGPLPGGGGAPTPGPTIAPGTRATGTGTLLIPH